MGGSIDQLYSFLMRLEGVVGVAILLNTFFGLVCRRQNALLCSLSFVDDATPLLSPLQGQVWTRIQNLQTSRLLFAWCLLRSRPIPSFCPSYCFPHAPPTRMLLTGICTVIAR